MLLMALLPPGGTTPVNGDGSLEAMPATVTAVPGFGPPPSDAIAPRPPNGPPVAKPVATRPTSVIVFPIVERSDILEAEGGVIGAGDTTGAEKISGGGTKGNDRRHLRAAGVDRVRRANATTRQCRR